MLTLGRNSLDWALNHAVNQGDTDVLPLPFEYEALEHDWDRVRPELEKIDVLEWSVRPHRTLLAPKGRRGFRVITQLDPLDFLLFTALVYEIGADIEASRIPASKKMVFSYRFCPQPDGYPFDKDIGFSKFLHRTGEILDNSRNITHVAVTDIADFYHRIYHHRLENALQAATSRTSHVKAIMSLLKGWNATETFGIPVGNAPSRMLAEIAIADVDQDLLARGIQFVRFNDDYRIFASSYAEGYRNLASLANVLWSNHGLNLQPQKTDILEVDIFRERYLPNLEDRAFESVRQRFQDLIHQLGLAGEYDAIEYDDLDAEQKKVIDSWNLAEMLREELRQSDDPDVQVLRFVLRRLAQLADASLVNDVFSQIDALHHVFSDVVRYLQSLRRSSVVDHAEIGKRVLQLLSDSIVSELEYHRMWALDMFTHSTEWDSEQEFMRIFSNARDDHSRRKLILAMGRAGQRYWFQSQWRSLANYTPWPRRALLAASSCLTPDARKAWYRAIEKQLDPLEKAVMRWARQNPFA